MQPAATLWVPQLRARIHCLITERAGSSLHVRLLGSSSARAGLAPGMEVEISARQGGTILSAGAVITRLEERDAWLEISVSRTHQEGRRYHRASLGGQGTFRAISPSGQSSRWRVCTLLDVSVGGLGFLVEQGEPVPDHIEVTFMLPADTNGLTSRLPVQAMGRVCRRNARPDGMLEVGIQFLALQPHDRERIALLTGENAWKPAA